jgi:DNA-binding response OmpR family regulator
MGRINVLLVEDNEDMREAVKEYLQDVGYGVKTASSAEAAIKQDYHTNSDLAVLDIALPGMSGLEYTHYIRSNGYDRPIIGLTARDSIDDKITGLETGMNDYVIKPFDLRELEARIKAQLRTQGSYNDLQTISTKSFRIEPKRHKFFVGSTETKLTSVEFRIMLKLMQFNHSTVGTTDLIEFAWGEEATLSNPPIRIHISNLRNKINDSELTTISTIPGKGYMLQD